MDHKKLEAYRKEYRGVEMSEKDYQLMLLRMQQAKKERREMMEKTMTEKEMTKKKSYRGWVVAAAASLALIALPNTSSNVAYAMGKIPVLGGFFKLVTVREFQYEDDKKSAEIRVDQITMDNSSKDRTSDKGEKSVDEINKEIQKFTEQWEQEFKKNLEKDGYEDMTISSEPVATTDDYFTVKLTAAQTMASGYEEQRYYTIDLRTGERVKISDLFRAGADYQTKLTQIIESKMREEMKADKRKTYFVDDEEVNLKDEVTNAQFYVNPEGVIVLSFNECSVAPAYMRVVQFEVRPAELEGLLK